MNSAAFAPDDVDDARRGAPAYDLGAYAAARGLQPLGSVIQGHFLGLTPRFSEYTFNVLRGTFPGDRFGAIQHELYEIEMSAGRLRFNGELYGTRVAGRVPVSEFLGISVDRSQQPFGDDVTLVPTTTILVHAPETVFLPAVLVRRDAFLTLLSPSLQPAAPGFAMNGTDHIDDVLRAAIGTSMGPTLRSLRFPFVEVRLSYGRLALTVNGFVAAADQLDALVNAASVLADALAHLCSAWWAPDHFDTPLAPFDSAGHPRGWPSAMFTGPLDDSLTTSLQTIARDMRASIEDPVALHRRFPRLPIPGAFARRDRRAPAGHARGRPAHVALPEPSRVVDGAARWSRLRCPARSGRHRRRRLPRE